LDAPFKAYGRLRAVLEAACAEEHCSRQSLTVLAKDNDPYRVDTPAGHRDAEWAAEHLERAFGPYRNADPRGLHYACVAAGDIVKPNGEIYINSPGDDAWLALAIKSARWLSYIPFGRISDNRNSEPLIFRASGRVERPSASLRTYAFIGSIETPRVCFASPEPALDNFNRPQPYAIVIFGEKSSLEDVLLPIARRYSADLYLGAGEASDSLLHQMAKDGAEDGRPLVVITATDFDPAGWQMPVSIGRKLQAFRDLLFPDLQFEVVPAALTIDQVRTLDLPSTPLKESEKRASRWREEFGHEQTEIDALATLRPNVLREIIERAIAPYYDSTLDQRIARARDAWRRRAQRIVDRRIDDQELDELRESARAIEAELKEKIDALTSEADDRIAVINERLEEMIEGIELPKAVLPEVELAEKAWQAILVSSEWSFAKASQALKARKSYGEGES